MREESAVNGDNLGILFFISSPEHEVLMVSYCGQSLSVVRREASTVALQGSRGRRILRPGTHKSWSGLLKISKAESAGRMFFPVGLLLIMIGLFD